MRPLVPSDMTTVWPSRPSARSRATCSSPCTNARDCTASTQKPAAARLGAAPNITESPSAYWAIGVAKHGSPGGAGAAAVVVGATVVVVTATVVVGASVVVGGDGRRRAHRGRGGRCPVRRRGPRPARRRRGRRSSVGSASWAAAISFGRTSAVARLAPANPATAIAAATVPANARRMGSGRSRCTRRHARRCVPRRIGVSINRYDTSVTATEMTTAVTNSTTDNARPATPRIAW